MNYESIIQNPSNFGGTLTKYEVQNMTECSKCIDLIQSLCVGDMNSLCLICIIVFQIMEQDEDILYYYTQARKCYKAVTSE